ncbi:MAG TPA: hypothetical protein VMT52_16155 [Planctomycetota bacterium]|nr:hypothetical protein [Planctomycetota bacterium]
MMSEAAAARSGLTMEGPGAASGLYTSYADKHLYCLTQDGLMGLVEVHPEKYIEKSRFVFKAYKNFKTGGLSEKDEKPTWAHPVMSHGKLFLRDQDSLVAYDVKSRPKTAEK